jgi:serine/threonine-protein kinase
LRICPQCGREYGADDRFCTVDGAALVVSGQAASLIGTVLADRYLVHERLGEGGMGEVYLAEHIRIKRKVAVKLMRSWMVGDPVAVSRFHREAENASQISHPNVAQVYDFGETSDGMIYLAMEFVPGEPLSAIIEREGRLHAVRAAEIVRQTAEALVAAHGMGILHRDLKPDNIMVARSRAGTDIVKLVDFGIARVMNRGTQQFTSTGMIVGTPDYMSPEQLAGEALDERSDLYALALIAFQLLTGDGAFKGGSSNDALLARLMGAPRTLAEVRPEVPWPPVLQAAFDRALAADPAKRYADALEFAAELDGAMSAMPLSEEEQAFLVLLSQRTATPSRGAMAIDTRTPARSVSALRDGDSSTQTPVTAQRAVGLVTPPSESKAIPRPSTADLIAAEGARHTGGASDANVPDIEPAMATPPVGPDGEDDGEAAPTEFATASEPLEVGSGGATAPAGRTRRSPVPLIGAALGVAAVVTAIVMLRGDAEPSPQGALPPDSALVQESTFVAAQDTLPVTSAASAASDSLRLQRARSGVLGLASAAGRGSAFLVDSIGLLVTSPSLIPADRQVDIFVDADHTVRATVVSVDSAAGIATLKVAPARCRRCRPLAIGEGDTTLAAVTAGDSLVALPVARRVSVTPQGAVVARLSGATFSTSGALGAATVGAPLFNARTGAVAGMSTRRRSGSTVVGASAIRTAVVAARSAAASMAVNDTLYRTWPLRPVPEGDIAAAEAKTPELETYRSSAGTFDVLAMTPQFFAWRLAQSAPPTAEDNPFAIPSRTTPPPKDPIVEWRSWRAYRDERRAVVILQVSPDRAAWPAVSDKPIDIRRGDVVSVVVTRDGTPLVPLESQRILAVGNPDIYRRERKPIPNSGVYVFHPADFAATGATYQVEVTDANGNRRVAGTLSPAMLQAIARDLGPWQR